MVRKAIIIGAATIIAGYSIYSCSTKPVTLEERNRELLKEYVATHSPLPLYESEHVPEQKRQLLKNTQDKATALKHWARENLDALLDFNQEEP